jgi:hypothetical protein
MEAGPQIGRKGRKYGNKKEKKEKETRGQIFRN